MHPLWIQGVGVDLGAPPCLGHLYGAPHKANLVRIVRHNQCSIMGIPDI